MVIWGLYRSAIRAALGTFAHVEFSLDLLRENLIPVQSWAGTGAFCVSPAPVLLKVSV